MENFPYLNKKLGRGGGGFNPCPKVFGAPFLSVLYLGKMPKGRDGKSVAKIFGEFLMILYCWILFMVFLFGTMFKSLIIFSGKQY